MANTNWTPAKSLTFSDAMSLTWLVFWLAWRVASGSLMAWFSGGATVNFQAIPPQRDSADTVSERLTVTLETGTITVTVTPKVT